MKAKKEKTDSFYKQRYEKEARPALVKAFGFKNVMETPRLEKIVLNTSLKEALVDKKILDKAKGDMALIAGQLPRLTAAKKSISNFKLRQGQPIGLSVTLRRERMFEFFNRLVNIVLPRVRDFRGVSPRGFDGRGNYTLGLTEHTIFPEIPYEKVEKTFGMNISFVTSAVNDEVGKALLKEMGMPFRER